MEKINHLITYELTKGKVIALHEAAPSYSAEPTDHTRTRKKGAGSAPQLRKFCSWSQVRNLRNLLLSRRPMPACSLSSLPPWRQHRERDLGSPCRGSRRRYRSFSF